MGVPINSIVHKSLHQSKVLLVKTIHKHETIVPGVELGACLSAHVTLNFVSSMLTLPRAIMACKDLDFKQCISARQVRNYGDENTGMGHMPPPPDIGQVPSHMETEVLNKYIVNYYWCPTTKLRMPSYAIATRLHKFRLNSSEVSDNGKIRFIT